MNDVDVPIRVNESRPAVQSSNPVHNPVQRLETTILLGHWRCTETYMGSSSSKAIAADTTYTHSSWYTGSANRIVRVCSCCVEIPLGLGVHHCIVVECPSMDKWVIYEWSSNGAEYYACSMICGQDCVTLGEHTLVIKPPEPPVTEPIMAQGITTILGQKK